MKGILSGLEFGQETKRERADFVLKTITNEQNKNMMKELFCDEAKYFIKKATKNAFNISDYELFFNKCFNYLESFISIFCNSESEKVSTGYKHIDCILEKILDSDDLFVIQECNYFIINKFKSLIIKHLKFILEEHYYVFKEKKHCSFEDINDKKPALILSSGRHIEKFLNEDNSGIHSFDLNDSQFNFFVTCAHVSEKFYGPNILTFIYNRYGPQSETICFYENSINIYVECDTTRFSFDSLIRNYDFVDDKVFFLK